MLFSRVGQGSFLPSVSFGRSLPVYTSTSSRQAWARIGQTPGSSQYPRMRCRTLCDLYPDTVLLAGPIGRLTSLSTVRVIESRQNGQSHVEVESGPLAGRRGLVPTSDLVLVQSNLPIPSPIITRPTGPASPFTPAPGIPNRPPQVELPGREPPLPSSVQPIPEPENPEPGRPRPSFPSTPPITSTPSTPSVPDAGEARPWYETAGEVLLLTSPAWGAVLLSTLIRR